MMADTDPDYPVCNIHSTVTMGHVLYYILTPYLVASNPLFRFVGVKGDGSHSLN